MNELKHISCCRGVFASVVRPDQSVGFAAVNHRYAHRRRSAYLIDEFVRDGNRFIWKRDKWLFQNRTTYFNPVVYLRTVDSAGFRSSNMVGKSTIKVAPWSPPVLSAVIEPR
jgi:hypothetical protein